jgi:hypothetical protein
MTEMDNFGGLYKLELAPLAGAFAPVIFTGETAQLKTSINETPQGVTVDVEITFSYPAIETAQAALIDSFALATEGIKARLTDNNGYFFVFGGNGDIFLIAQEKDSGAAPEDFNGIAARIFGTVTWQ